MMVMEYLKRCLFLLPLLPALTGCGMLNDKFGRIEEGRTSVTVGTQHSRGNGLLAPFACPSPTCLTGGVMVYAVRTDGLKQAFMMPDETQPVTVNIPNGDYNFFAFGWDDVDIQATATRCGVIKGASLSGTAVDLTLTMSQEACTATTDYAPSYARASGSPQQLAPLQIAFCGHYANIGSLSPGAACPTGAETSWMFKGNSTSNVGEGDYIPNANTVVFAAAISNGTISELYATDMNTGIQRKISSPFPSGATGVIQVVAVPGSTKAVFTGDLNTAGKIELFVVDLSTNVIKQISKASPAGSVKAVRIGIANSKPYAIYAGEMDTTGVTELYSVDLSVPPPATPPTTPVKISSSMASGTGIYNCGCMGGGWEAWRFAISTDTHPDDDGGRTSTNTLNPYVVYIAQNASSGPKKVFITSLDGTNLPGPTTPGTMISGSEITSSTDYADMISLSYDGVYIAYHAHNGSGDGVYVVKYNTGGAPTVVSGVCDIPSCSAIGPWMKMSTGGHFMAYAKTPGTPTVYLVDLDNPGTVNTSVIVGNAGAQETGVARIRFTPDDSHVVASTTDGTNTYYIRSALTASPYTSATVTHPASGTIRTIKPSGGENFAISPDSLYVMYDVDLNGANKVELFYAPVGGGTANAISGSIAGTANSVVSYAFYGTSSSYTPYFAANADGAGYNELYSTALSASPTRVRLNSGNVAGSIVDLSQGGPLGGIVLYNANPKIGGSNKEMYAYFPSANKHMRVTKINGGASGIGSIKVRMMTYGPGLTSSLPFGGSIDSGCFVAPGADGGPVITAVKVPLGSGTGDAPFALEVDVFPQGYPANCTGTPIRYVFPSGIANYASAMGSNAYVTGDGSGTLSLFIKDY